MYSGADSSYFYRVADALSNREADAVARDLLKRLGVDTSGWTAEVSESGSGVVCSEPSPTCEPSSAEISEKTVVMHPVHQTYPTRGLEWQVVVGAGRKPTSLFGTLATLEDSGEYPLRTLAEAIEDLQAGKDVIQGLWAAAEAPVALELEPMEPPRVPGVEIVEIADVRLTLEVLSRSDRSGELLVPVYDFLDAGGSVVASVVAVDRDLVTVEIPRILPLPAPAQSPAAAS
jgi:hypothetical protein